MNEVYVFDLNGTIAAVEQPMENNFAKIFLPWLKTHKSYLVSGGTHEETEARLPREIFESFYGIYPSNWSVGLVDDSKPEQELLDALEELRSHTKYPGSLHERPIKYSNGLYEFCVIGFDAPHEDLEKYAA